MQLGWLMVRTVLISLKFKPDLVFGQAVPHIGYTAFLLGKPFIVFEDTEVSRLLHRLVHPFADAIVAPTVSNAPGPAPDNHPYRV